MLKKPDVTVGSVTELTAEWMRSRGLRGLLLDLDNTLARYGGDKAPEAIEHWIGELRGQGFLLAVCSNAKERRVKSFCGPLGLPYVHTARKPFSRGLLKALTRLGLQPCHTAMVGDQLFTDVWSGHRAGMLTVLVEPLENTFIFRARRAFERIFMGGHGEKR